MIFSVLEEKDVVLRERKPKEAVFFGLLLYFNGSSFRCIADTFSLCGVIVSHVAVWKWVQKFGSNVKDTLLSKNGSLPNVIVVDGGTWYKDAMNQLEIRRQVVCGGIRNYIERWFETLKDRLRNFDIYFPHKKPGVIDVYRCRQENFKHVINWLSAFVYYCNRIRRHMRLGGRTPFNYYQEVLS
jgi:transposase-like protein